jgi:hypothetical protein
MWICFYKKGEESVFCGITSSSSFRGTLVTLFSFWVLDTLLQSLSQSLTFVVSFQTFIGNFFPLLLPTDKPNVSKSCQDFILFSIFSQMKQVDVVSLLSDFSLPCLLSNIHNA